MKRPYREHISTKLWNGTLKKLRMVYALTGSESMSSILDRLVSAELERLERLEQGDGDE